MAIVFSAISPHPPIIIKSIGKENTSLLDKTVKAYSILEKKLIESNPEVIIIITSHGNRLDNSFALNLSPSFNGNLEEFSDFSSKFHFKGDIGLLYKIREKLETKSPLQLISNENLDYASLIPLILLSKKLKDIKIIPVHVSNLSLQAHFDFGQDLQEELIVNNERIAIISSADLSHRLTKDAPAGYSPKGKKFDKRLIEYLKSNSTKEIINMDEGLIKEAAECGLKSIVMLLGILNNIKHKPDLLSYEYPFGVGYLTMNFNL